jgi:hypothetical protein
MSTFHIISILYSPKLESPTANSIPGKGERLALIGHTVSGEGGAEDNQHESKWNYKEDTTICSRTIEKALYQLPDYYPSINTNLPYCPFPPRLPRRAVAAKSQISNMIVTVFSRE